MELVFHKDNGLYITEFEVTSDFNIHLERSKGGKVSFYQRTTNGDYDNIESLSKNIDKIFDYDFQALVYPKTIKITSECEFDVATLTTDGEVTEIKSQSKEVEITSNGTTQIAPDAGFSYLNGVTVNVNVPQSGGGESGGGKEPYDNLVYLEVGSDISFLEVLGAYVVFGRGENANMKMVSTFWNVLAMCEMEDEYFRLTLTHIAIDENFIPKINQGGVVQEVDFQTNLSKYESLKDFYNALPRITKEEFFNLA